MRRDLRLAVLAALLCACLPAIAASSAAAVSPLPEADYAVRSACALPQPGHAGCLALELRPVSAAARALTHPLGMTRQAPIRAGQASEGVYGLRPEDLEHAYFPGAEEHPDAPATEPQTIALIDAYNDYKALADLKTYSKEFGLPELPSCSSTVKQACFEQVNQKGESGASRLPFPHSELELETRELLCLGNTTGSKTEVEAACAAVAEAEGWAIEISTDIEIAHAVCQDCKILLVEAESSSYSALVQAESTAVSLGATEVSNSWGGGEPETSDALGRKELEGDAAAFHHPGTVITASAGDQGYFNWGEYEAAVLAAQHGEQTSYSDSANFPASLPYVVAVGGTRLMLSDHARASEIVWNERSDPEGESSGAGGGGCSRLFAAPPWQQQVPDWSQVGCGVKRAVADVAADADPYTGVAVYDSVLDRREENGKVVNTAPGWLPIGGTSVASPIVASMFALAGGSHGVEYPAQTLYSHLQTTSLYDVTEGGNGVCDNDYGPCAGSMSPASPLYPFDCGAGVLICNAAEGCGDQFYDGPTGVGSPNGIAGFMPGQQPAIARECSAGGASGNGVGGGVGAGAGGVEEPAEAPAQSPPSQPAAPQPGSSKSKVAQKAQRPKLLALALAHAVLSARHGGAPSGRRVIFTVTMSGVAKARLTLARRVGAHRGKHWRKLGAASMSLSLKRGNSRHRLPRRVRLPAGSYRITVTLLSGGSRSIGFTVR